MKAETLQQLALSGRYMQDGDYLQLSNQWGTVTITWVSDGKQASYVVSGNLINVREEPFSDLGQAIEYAWRALAHYANGRG